MWVPARCLALVIGWLTLTLTGSASAAETFWGLTTEHTLVRFSSTAPGTTLATLPISGLRDGEHLVGIEVLGDDGSLVGISNTARVYDIQRNTGAATARYAGQDTFTTPGTAFGFAGLGANTGRRHERRRDAIAIADNGGIVTDAEARLVLSEAVAICRGRKTANPDRAAALRVRGRLLAPTAHGDELALACFTRALVDHPDDPYALADAAEIVLRRGWIDDAARLLRRATALAPTLEDPVLQNRLATACLRAGRLADARDIYAAALHRHAERADLHVGLGNVFREEGRLEEALAQYVQALTFDPANADAWLQRGGVHLQRKEYQAAADACREGLQCDPERSDLHTVLGTALQGLEAFEDAIAAFRAALTHAPRDLDAARSLVSLLNALGRRREAAEAYLSLGAALENRGYLDEAEDAFREALARKAESPRAEFAVGAAQRQLGRSREAAAHLEAATAREPLHAPAHLALGWTQHLLGDASAGWREFAWYDRYGERRRRYFEQPLWNGAPIDGGRILLWADQAIGDTLQFVRFARFVKARGLRVLLECQGRSIPVLQRVEGIDDFVVRGMPGPSYDVHAPLTHLPRILGDEAIATPFQQPYLSVDKQLDVTWKERLGPRTDTRVGLSWSGDLTYVPARTRAMPFAAFAPLAHTPGVRFISLQHGPPALELLAPPRDLHVDIYPEEARSLADTAALIANLDLVITVDTMIAHLAGALGRPVWTLLSFAADWRWGSDPERTPWYPTMRLFRQTRIADWSSVLARVRAAFDADDQASPEPHR